MREIDGDLADLGLHLHPHRHRDIAGHQLRVPDRPRPRALDVVLVDIETAEFVAHHPAFVSGAFKALTLTGSQDGAAAIAEAKVVAMPAVKDRHLQRATSTAGDLALEQQIRGEVIDRAAQIAGIDRGDRFRRSRRDAAAWRAVALIGDLVMNHDTVARGFAVETLGMWDVGRLVPA